MGRLEGKVAVITGGASGIGLAAARRMVEQGASVVIGDLERAEPAQAAERLSSDGGRAAGIAVDATSEDSLRDLVEGAVERYGRLDVMCNHVGGSSPTKDLDLLRLDLEHYDDVMDLNVRSAVVGSRLALPHLIAAGGGSIINTASVGGLNGDYLQVAYGTAKAAVIRLTQYVATQYGPQGVRCNSVAPGAIMTPALRDNLSEEAIESIRSHNSLPFTGEADDIAWAMVFLASDESRYITGQCLVVDGGMTSHSTIAEDRRSLLPDQPVG